MFLGGIPSCFSVSKDFLIDVWRFDDELPRDGINSMAQGSDGYLWVSSRYGLARFDGVRFSDFSSRLQAQFPGYHYANLAVDRLGTVWLATPGEGLQQWRAGRLVPCLKAENPVFGPVVAGLTNAQGRGLAVTPDGRVVGWSNGVSELVADARRWGAPVPCSFCQDQHAAIWFVTYQHSLVRVSGINPREMGYGTGETRRNWIALQADAQGALWAGTQRGVGVWRGDDFQPVESPVEPFAVDDVVAVPQRAAALSVSLPSRATGSAAAGLWVVSGGQAWLRAGDRWLTNVAFEASAGAYETSPRLVDHEGNLWFTTTEASLACAGADGRLTLLTPNDGLPSGRVVALYEDREGSIWVGIEHAGLARLRKRYFEEIGWRAGTRGPLVWAVVEDPTGAIWLGTEHDGLHRWQEGRFTEFDLGPNGLPGSVYSLCVDHTGTLWAGTEDRGVFRFENGRFVPVWEYVDPGWNKRIYVTYEDRAGRIWLGTGMGLFYLERGEVHHVKGKDFDMGLVRALTEDAAGRLWVGLSAGAPFRLAWVEGEQLIAQGTQVGLLGHDILGLHADRDGTVWIGTVGDGLWRWRDGVFVHYQVADGLPDDRIYAIETDGAGNLWLGSSAGIFLVSQAALDRLATNRTNHLSCLRFDRTDGLPTRECSGGSQPSIGRTRDGRLLFALAEGAVVLAPERVQVNPVPPVVSVEAVRVDGKLSEPLLRRTAGDPATGGRPGRGQLALGPGRHVVEFEYTATSLITPSKVRFKRQLEGVDTHWRPPDAARSATYSLTAPGRYRFRVTACNNDGIWNEAGTGIELTVAPYFWQSWSFKFGAPLALFLGVGGSLRYFERRRMQRRLEYLEMQQMVQKERARIARDIHDELGASLTEIGLLSEFAQRDSAPAEQIRRDVGRIAAQARSSTRALDEIVWAVNPRNDTVEGFVNYASAYAEEQLRLANLRCRLEVPSPLPQRWLRADRRHHLFLAFKEALNNVLKHARASQVELRFQVDSERLSVGIRDDGCGFASDTNSKPGASHNGLGNMKERLAGVGGGFACQSEPGRGTSVTLTINLE